MAERKHVSAGGARCCLRSSRRTATPPSAAQNGAALDPFQRDRLRRARAAQAPSLDSRGHDSGLRAPRDHDVCLPPRGENADLSRTRSLRLLHLGVASAADEGAAASAAPAAASAASAFLCRHEPGNHCHSRFLEHRILPDPVRSPSRVAKGRPFHTSRPHALPRVLNCRGRAAGVVSSGCGEQQGESASVTRGAGLTDLSTTLVTSQWYASGSHLQARATTQLRHGLGGLTRGASPLEFPAVSVYPIANAIVRHA